MRRLWRTLRQAQGDMVGLVLLGCEAFAYHALRGAC
jgi:hypothetical protein